MTQITQYIRNNSPNTKIVLLGLLPRGAQYWDPAQAYIWPNRYQAAIAAVNEGYYVRKSPIHEPLGVPGVPNMVISHAREG